MKLTSGIYWQVAEGGYRWVKATYEGDPVAGLFNFVGDADYPRKVDDNSPILQTPGQEGLWLIGLREQNQTVVDNTYDPPNLWRHSNLPLGSQGWRDYQPAKENPALFMEFAHLDGSPESIVGFANRWGALGAELSVPVRLSRGETIKPYADHLPVHCESLIAWQDEIRSMKQAIWFWEAAERQAVEDLGPLFVYEDSSIRFSFGFSIRDWVLGDIEENDVDGYEGLICDLSHYPERMIELGIDPRQIGNPSALPSDEVVIRAAQMAVVEYLTEGLLSRSNLQAEYDLEQNRAGISAVPYGLIGTMWLQFALAVEGDRHYRSCQVCSRWFELAPGSGRSDKIYCSRACQMRAYRKRKTGGKVERSDKP